MKSCPGADVNVSVAFSEKHPELQSDGNNNKRVVVSAFKNLGSWLKSLCLDVRKQELCDGMNDVAGEIGDGAGGSARGGLSHRPWRRR